MDKIKGYRILLLIILVLSGSAFYWFSWYPRHVRNLCMNESVPMNLPSYWQNFDANKNAFEIGDYLYHNCMRLHGLDK